MPCGMRFTIARVNRPHDKFVVDICSTSNCPPDGIRVVVLNSKEEVLVCRICEIARAELRPSGFFYDCAIVWCWHAPGGFGRFLKPRPPLRQISVIIHSIVRCGCILRRLRILLVGGMRRAILGGLFSLSRMFIFLSSRTGIEQRLSHKPGILNAGQGFIIPDRFLYSPSPPCIE